MIDRRLSLLSRMVALLAAVATSAVMLAYPVNTLAQADADPAIAWQQTLSGKGDVWSVAIGPGGVVFAAASNGVYRSTDNGGTWTLVAPGASAVAINPTNDYVFVGRSGGGGPLGNPGLSGGGGAGLYRSTDNGESWSYWNVGNPGVFGIGITSSGSVIAASSGPTGYNGGLFISADNGASWAYAADSCYAHSFVNTSNGDIFAGDIFQAFWAGQAPIGGVFRSTTGGVTWTPVGLENTPIYSLAATASDHLFAGSASTGIFRSTDGVTWTQVNGALTNPVTSLAVNSAGEVFAGVFGNGVFSSSDDDQTWAQRNTGLTDLRIEALAISSSDFIFVGTPSGVFRTVASTTAITVVAATDPNAAEAGPDLGVFTVTRSGDTTNAVTVNFTVGGTATPGVDYSAIGTSVTIPAGETTATVTVTPILDALIEGNETVILTLVPGDGYTVGSPDTATVTIADYTGGLLRGLSHVNFGSVRLGSSANRPLVITNGSTTETLVVRVNSASPPFSLVSGGGTVVIGPGLSQRVTLRFAPTTTGRVTGTLIINSSDPARPTASVALVGIGR